MEGVWFWGKGQAKFVNSLDHFFLGRGMSGAIPVEVIMANGHWVGLVEIDAMESQF